MRDCADDCAIKGHLVDSFPGNCPMCGAQPPPPPAPPPPPPALAVGHVVQLFRSNGAGETEFRARVTVCKPGHIVLDFGDAAGTADERQY
eukprot:gene6647-7149_t